MAVKDALLALLAGGAQYGYQLKSAFDDATGSAWPINVGQIYTTLQRHERDGLVEADGEPDEDGRQPYKLTAEGREALAAWVDTPIEQPIASRDEVSMKVLIAVATGVAPALDVVGQQRQAAMGTLQSFTALKRDAAREPLAWQLHLDRLVLAVEAEIRWLDLVEERLAATASRSGEAPPRTGKTNPGKANSGQSSGQGSTR